MNPKELLQAMWEEWELMAVKAEELKDQDLDGDEKAALEKEFERSKDMVSTGIQLLQMDLGIRSLEMTTDLFKEIE